MLKMMSFHLLVKVYLLVFLLIGFSQRTCGDSLVVQNLLTTRQQRFPSVKERVQIYMGNWYTPPCIANTKNAIQYYFNQQPPDIKSSSPQQVVIKSPENRTYEISSTIEADKIFFLDMDELIECVKVNNAANLSKSEPEDETQFKLRKKALILNNMKRYCRDVLFSLAPILLNIREDLETEYRPVAPVLAQFGDLQHSHIYGSPSIPYFKKFRIAATKQEVSRVASNDCLAEPSGPLQPNAQATNNIMQPIIWKLSVERHYQHLSTVEHEDTPWDLKKPMAVFRGQLTGSLQAYNPNLSDEENCLEWRRCRLVYHHSNSTLVDAKLTSTRKRLPNILNGVNLVGSSTSLSKMMEYKAIIMLEGNDVASGLKWALLSQSVVLMPPPKYTSWAMEELLVPWVHYIPLKEDVTDVEEKIQWVIRNDHLARQIAQSGSLWIEDLCFHPDAAWEDRMIQKEMVRRYMAHWIPVSLVS